MDLLRLFARALSRKTYILRLSHCPPQEELTAASAFKIPSRRHRSSQPTGALRDGGIWPLAESLLLGGKAEERTVLASPECLPSRLSCPAKKCAS